MRLSKEEQLEKLNESIKQAESWGIEVVVRENNSEYRGFQQNIPNHLTFKGVRNVEYYPTKDTVFANMVKGKYRKVKTTGIKNAVELAKNGVL